MAMTFRLMTAFVLIVLITLAKSQVTLAAQYRYIKPRTDKVILVFLPGIFGSRLFNTETREWHWGEDDYGSRGLSLEHFPDYDVSLLERAKVRFWGVQVKDRNVYSDFKNHGQWVAGAIESFPYDWRKSNRKTAAEFDRWLCKKLPPADSRVRIVFVAHSMGGLVLRHWLKDFLEPKSGCDRNRITADQIDQIVFAGTPHLGSLEPVESLFTGKSALTEERFFSLLFSDNVVRDALTFESTYELLPAYNVVQPECDANDPTLSAKLVVVSDTGTRIKLQLWNTLHWGKLGLPNKLPEGMDRIALMEIVSLRLQAAAETVCSLLTHQHPPNLRSKMMFLTGSKTRSDGETKIQDTLSEITFHTGGQGRRIRPINALGDGTVPSWSSYPPWRHGPQDFISVSAHHDALLSNADAKLMIEKMLGHAAISAATEIGEMLSIEPNDKGTLRKALIEFAALDPARIDPAIYEMAVEQFHEAATMAGMNGNELFELANAYSGANRSAFRAIGFAVAARDVSMLNVDRQFWAHQNSAYALHQFGASNLAVSAAFSAGKANIINFGAEEGANMVAVPGKFFNHDSKWRSVAARSLEQIELKPAARAIDSKPMRSLHEFNAFIPAGGKHGAFPLDIR